MLMKDQCDGTHNRVVVSLEFASYEAWGSHLGRILRRAQGVPSEVAFQGGDKWFSDHRELTRNDEEGWTDDCRRYPHAPSGHFGGVFHKPDVGGLAILYQRDELFQINLLARRLLSRAHHVEAASIGFEASTIAASTQWAVRVERNMAELGCIAERPTLYGAIDNNRAA